MKSSITKMKNSPEQLNSRYKLKEESYELQQRLYNMKNRDKDENKQTH